MNNKILPSLKLVFKPLIMYYGEWDLRNELKNISLENNNKKLFDKFIERYYYMPLNVIFKDEQLVKSFKYAICSKLGEEGRNLYFSKKAFLRNVISNTDEVVLAGGEKVYKEIKKAIRARKDIYRDVYSNGENSIHYQEILEEYNNSKLDIIFLEYVTLCKKKYTKLLSGYNAVLDFFDRPLNLDKFIECFDVNELYLFTIYSILKNCEINYNKYGKLDYTVNYIDSYKDLIKELRLEDKKYNVKINLSNNKEYTVDDLFNEYDELLSKIN